MDEYQDVNDLQNEIFEILSGKGKNFFTVGDVKQCIYRFRLSDPSNFLRRAETLPPYRDGQTDGVVVLSGNFRSSEQICDFINTLFFMLMKKETAGILYDHTQRLEAKKTRIDGYQGAQLNLVQHTDEQTGQTTEHQMLGVYVLLAGRAEFKQVKVVTESQDFYVVNGVDASAADTLRSGDEVIVRAVGLYDGKLMDA